MDLKLYELPISSSKSRVKGMLDKDKKISGLVKSFSISRCLHIYALRSHLISLN